MPLILPKENATQEEINAWIVETQENYDRIEKELEEKTNREKELMEHNQKLFLKITSKKDLLKINSVDIEEEKSQEVPASTASETCEVEVPNVIKTNEVVVNATELSQAEIDDLRG